MSIEILDFTSADEFGIMTNLIRARIVHNGNERYVLRLFYSQSIHSIPEVLRGKRNPGGYRKIEFNSLEEMQRVRLTEIPDRLWNETDEGFGYGISEREINNALREYSKRS